MYKDECVENISGRIEMLRQELNLKGVNNIHDPHVYRISCELDRLIMSFYKSQINIKVSQ